MPQLDKYIFYNQIIGLIVIFFLIYCYLRVHGIPIIGSLILYRKRRLAIYKIVNLAMRHVALHRHVIWRKRGNIFMPKFVKTFVKGLNTFEKKVKKQLAQKTKKLIWRFKPRNNFTNYKILMETTRFTNLNKKFN